MVSKVEEKAEDEFRKTTPARVGKKQSVTPIQALGRRNSGTSDLYFTVQSGQPYTQLCLQNIIIQLDFFSFLLETKKVAEMAASGVNI